MSHLCRVVLDISCDMFLVLVDRSVTSVRTGVGGIEAVSCVSSSENAEEQPAALVDQGASISEMHESV